MAEPWAHDAEVERIRHAYRDHDTSAAVRARRDAGNLGNRLIVAERVERMRAALDRRGLLPLGGRKIIDVGCGRGSILASLRELGASEVNLFGVDLLADRIEGARRAHPAIHFSWANAERLEASDEAFDIAIAFTLFSSILDEGMARNVAREMERVLVPGGAVLWYDFRFKHPLNRHTKGMGRRKIRMLFPGFQQALDSITVLPPLARTLGPASRALYPVLAAVPPLRTHYLGLLTKPGRS